MGCSKKLAFNRPLCRSHHLGDLAYAHTLEYLQLENHPLPFRKRPQGLPNFKVQLLAAQSSCGITSLIHIRLLFGAFPRAFSPRFPWPP